jgi:hypothetical protein
LFIETPSLHMEPNVRNGARSVVDVVRKRFVRGTKHVEVIMLVIQIHGNLTH